MKEHVQIVFMPHSFDSAIASAVEFWAEQLGISNTVTTFKTWNAWQQSTADLFVKANYCVLVYASDAMRLAETVATMRLIKDDKSRLARVIVFVYPALATTSIGKSADKGDGSEVNALWTEESTRSSRLVFIDVIDLIHRHWDNTRWNDSTALERATLIATEIIQTLYSATALPFKALALDCDETLWKGCCSEQHSSSLEFLPHHVALQSLAQSCAKNGVLVCLCSRNDESDVHGVFETRRDLALDLELLVAEQINWLPKSLNLRSLADALNVSLRGFLLIDDDPFVHADVRGRCPEVVVISPPTRASDLRRLTSLLLPSIAGQPFTDEDGMRSESYKQESKRAFSRKAATSSSEYLNDLGLQIVISDATGSEMSRLNQLARRVTQFVTSTQGICNQDGEHCGERRTWSIRVEDRFGPYGIVGAVSLEISNGTLRVTQWLMSCRALGRTVEDTTIGRLAQLARDHSCEWLVIPLVITRRNQVVQTFLSTVYKLAGETVEKNEFGICYRLSVTRLLVALHSTYWGYALEGPSEAMERRPDKPHEIADPSLVRRARALEALLNSPRLGDLAVMTFPQRALHGDGDGVSDAVGIVNKIWSDVLKNEAFGPDDDLFDLGADSFAAVLILTAIREQLGVEVPLSFLFSNVFTVNELAQFVSRSVTSGLR